MAAGPTPPLPKPTPAQQERLLALLAQGSALVAGGTCDSSTECCRFGITGRQPYVTFVELIHLLRHDAQAAGKRARRLAVLSPIEHLAQDTCAFLAPTGRCRAYDARPLGCRTFFCDRASVPMRMDRAALRRIGWELQQLSRELGDGREGRPLHQALAEYRPELLREG